VGFGFEGQDEAATQTTPSAVRANVEALQLAIARTKDERPTAQQAVVAADGEEDEIVAIEVEGADASRLVGVEIVEMGVALCE
jgi:hypothetical protein